MASSVEILGSVEGMNRDSGVDSLPRGRVWDLRDYVPNRKGANLEQRGPWAYFGATDYLNTIWGGRYTQFTKGFKFLINANANIFDVNLTTGAGVTVGAGPPSMVQNAVKLRDRVYFLDGSGAAVPRVATYDGVTVTVASLQASAPKAKVGTAWRDRLVLGGAPVNPSNVFFSPLETDGGAVGAWDPLSTIGTSAEVTGIAALPGTLLVFHPSMIERIRGTIPPGLNLTSDMSVDTLTDQVGCTMAQTIVPWRENLCFADERGVFQTDGATVKNLIELGGMGDFWRSAYGNKVSGASVACGIFLDYLIVTVTTLGQQYPVTMVCDLNARTWWRFTNFAATCYIPSEGPIEEQFCGNYFSHRIMKVSSMFTDDVLQSAPFPDYIDGNGTAVKGSVSTGFKRLSNQEGLDRVRLLRMSYTHRSFVSAPNTSGMTAYYRTTPPEPEEIDLNDPSSTTGWTTAGVVPDASVYTRKKLPVGKHAYGIMVRIDATSPSRTSRLYSVGIERTLQDRGKVTT